ncbi:hypothetical protein K8Q98_01645 [Candidatus Nomurabacteria bacterium]|nr:hypothetical protein [Candidatus Nomurabacteria bacterium]
MKRFKFKLNNNNLYVILITAFALVVAVEAFFLFNGDTFSIKDKHNDALLNKYATNIVKLCSEERYRPSCYDREIPKLMDDISMEDAFKVTRIIQGQDSSYPYCHVLGHALSAREVKKDPSKWKEVVARVPSGVCSNGGIHGAFQERFRVEFFTPEEVEKIKPELFDVCEKRGVWNPTGLEQGSCYHALGHLTMYLTRADIKLSLKLCNEIAKKQNGKDFSQLCYDGAFMQIFQPLEPEDFDLISGKEVKSDQLLSFCKKFNDKERSSCWSEGWPLFFQEIMTPSGLVKYCSNSLLQHQEHSERCYLGLFYVVAAQMKLDVNRMNSFCSALPSPRDAECFAASASRMIETDYGNIVSAVKFCTEANNINNQQACYGNLVRYSTYNLHAGSPQFNTLCNALPVDWKNKCLKQVVL